MGTHGPTGPPPNGPMEPTGVAEAQAWQSLPLAAQLLTGQCGHTALTTYKLKRGAFYQPCELALDGHKVGQ